MDKQPRGDWRSGVRHGAVLMLDALFKGPTTAADVRPYYAYLYDWHLGEQAGHPSDDGWPLSYSEWQQAQVTPGAGAATRKGAEAAGTGR